MAAIVIVFDFDKTIIDVDSDNWVVDNFGATELFDRLLPTMPWNTLMDTMMRELHEQGKTTEDIAEVLKSAPLDPHIVTAIKAAYDFGCDLRILSDANPFFIETILKHHGLHNYFSEINTNLCFIDEEGRLRILPYHDFNTLPHDCSLGICPPNMCKGKIIRRIQESATADGKKRFIYLGDGRGDYCPSLHLAKEDFMMPRKDFPVWELISGNPGLLQAEVHPWKDGEELKNTLLKLINQILCESSELASTGCKESAPLSLQHGLPPTFRVKN